MRMFCHNSECMKGVVCSAKNNIDYKPNIERLLREADEYLLLPRLSVVDKTLIPPSQDMHDYYSIAPYFWPDPDKPDGLPYINRDGEFNPEFELCDRRRMDKICAAVRTLTLAYLLTDAEKYRVHAIKLIRCYFINPETRMNPHLEYAQAIKGKCEGRGIGIIDIRYLYRMLDMMNFLNDDLLITEMTKWLCELQNWIMTSQKGHDESIRENNHGTWFDVTNISIALFTKNYRLAENILNLFAEKRIASQVEEDGSMPRELKRTRSFLYSTLNLYGFFMAASLGESIGIDIWGTKGIRKAFDFMIPAYIDYSKWNYEQIADNWEQTWEQAYEIMCIASKVYQQPEIRADAERLRQRWIPDSDIIFFGR